MTSASIIIRAAVLIKEQGWAPSRWKGCVVATCRTTAIWLHSVVQIAIRTSASSRFQGCCGHLAVSRLEWSSSQEVRCSTSSCSSQTAIKKRRLLLSEIVATKRTHQIPMAQVSPRTSSTTILSRCKAMLWATQWWSSPSLPYHPSLRLLICKTNMSTTPNSWLPAERWLSTSMIIRTSNINSITMNNNKSMNHKISKGLWLRRNMVKNSNNRSIRNKISRSTWRPPISCRKFRC